ncbi:hypothetical protein CB1_000621015 [Camelus ferus]|nr:hypothetical protein CB1_000621015 [Camelus ferus]
MLPAVHVHHLTQLQDTWCQDKTCCSEVERKLAAASRQSLFMEKRARKSWMAAVGTDRKLKELREDSQHHRQALRVQGNPWPFLWGPGAPAALAATTRGPESPWDAACTCTVDQRWTTVFCFDSRALAV